MTQSSLTFQDIAPTDWLDLSQTFRDLTFEQTRAYAQPAAARIGGHARFAAIARGDQVLALAALRCRSLPGMQRGIIWLPAGPMVLRHGAENPTQEEIVAILSALRQRLVTAEGNILRLRFSALARLDQAPTADLAARAGFVPTSRSSPYMTYVLDTRQDEEEAMSRLNGKWRGHLRFAFRAELEVQHAGDDSLAHRFDQVFAAVKDTKGFTPAISPDFHRLCRAEGYHLETFIVSRQGTDLSAGMVVVTGQNANYLFGATASEGRDHRSGYQLTWSIRNYCHALGLTGLDLGGIDSNVTPELTVYKERTGALYAEGVGPYEAAPGGLFTPTVHLLEDLRARRKGKGV
jgi:Acetyltransferase (GNAT) domain